MSASIPVVRTKAGVDFAIIAPGGFRMLAAIDAATKVLAKDLTITAGTNDHSAGRHPVGEAYDLSVVGLTPLEIERCIRFLRQTLGDRFAVFYETPTDPVPALRAVALVSREATAPHIHLQVKKGTTYPPEPNVVAV